MNLFDFVKCSKLNNRFCINIRTLTLNKQYLRASSRCDIDVVFAAPRSNWRSSIQYYAPSHLLIYIAILTYSICSIYVSFFTNSSQCLHRRISPTFSFVLCTNLLSAQQKTFSSSPLHTQSLNSSMHIRSTHQLRHHHPHLRVPRRSIHFTFQLILLATSSSWEMQSI